ncbi:SDR family NAD(P)-dependent oxidoreductase [Hoeflea prorocentri]|uniref:SDR family NAD(P)-dependent oxidoreductase n=1 Tax=Hoeflea prorocentri TaxID=1922333 RepID=A0A9X3UE85_9HYPH|nr:SDR family oxidoreductase [Hoeflea prorocentri]MCY6379697.1 SDR family NAD(P)-dependent oxidoreductase [Hoeflea prorocentri]MDA5397497.1 SDR family NAD(P)-dependent oxidoreductase [Hoeflea prorocentri]
MAKVALITGGGSGIGHATALKLAEEGHGIAIADRNEEAAKTVAAEVGGMAITLDVAKEADVDRTVEQVETDLGPIEILVNSAGVLQNAMSSRRMSMQEHDRIWQVNYRGTYMMCRSTGARMRARKTGAIVNLSSINGAMPLPLPAYAPGKAAIVSLTELLAAEMGPDMVRVNCVAPTFTLTPVLKQRIEAGQRDREAILNAGALPMFVMPEHIADAIAFLCSDRAAAITGVTLPVDAGWLAAIAYKNFVGPVED